MEKIRHDFVFNNKKPSVSIVAYQTIDKSGEPVLEYKALGIVSFTKEDLLIIASLTNWRKFTLKTNAGVDIHSSEFKNGRWKGIKIERL